MLAAMTKRTTASETTVDGPSAATGQDDGKLNITRITDLTQQGGYDASAQTDTGESDAPEQSAASAEPGTAGEPGKQGADEQSASESYSAFAKCEHVKP